ETSTFHDGNLHHAEIVRRHQIRIEIRSVRVTRQYVLTNVDGACRRVAERQRARIRGVVDAWNGPHAIDDGVKVSEPAGGSGIVDAVRQQTQGQEVCRVVAWIHL